VADALERIAALVEQAGGTRLGAPGMRTLRQALGRLAPGTPPEHLLRRSEAARLRGIVDALVGEVLVHETFFLRHPDELDRIDWRALVAAATAAGRPEVAVWSAGCSSGEEAYTLLIAAAEALGVGDPPVRVLGTDVSAAVLVRAREAIYGPRALQRLNALQRARWFVPHDDGLRVAEALRRRASFAQHNLVGDPAPPAGGPFDVVVCRNVLIYFAPATAAAVIERHGRALRPHGTLVLGAADRLALRRAGGPAATPPPAPARPAAPAPVRRSDDADVPDLAAETTAAAALEAGVDALARGETAAAVAALRRARYLEPDLVEAGVQLGRAHEAAGDVRAARLAYAGVLRQVAEPGSHGLDGRAAPADVEAACRARLLALTDHQDLP
jgi:chemotaxis protein methyltransferase CheR